MTYKNLFVARYIKKKFSSQLYHFTSTLPIVQVDIQKENLSQVRSYNSSRMAFFNIIVVIACVAGAAFVRPVPSGDSTLANELDSVVQDIDSSLSEVANQATNVFGNATEDANILSSSAAEEVTNLATSATNSTAGVFNTVMSQSSDFVSRAIDNTCSYFSAAVNSTSNTVSNAWNSATGAWRDLEEEVKEFIHFLM